MKLPSSMTVDHEPVTLDSALTVGKNSYIRHHNNNGEGYLVVAMGRPNVTPPRIYCRGGFFSEAPGDPTWPGRRDDSLGLLIEKPRYVN